MWIAPGDSHHQFSIRYDTNYRKLRTTTMAQGSLTVAHHGMGELGRDSYAGGASKLPVLGG